MPRKGEPDQDRHSGIYRKYLVKRLKDPSGKHRRCEFFVLDLVHDAFAADALDAYADACCLDYPELAEELRGKAARLRAVTSQAVHAP